MTDKAPNHRGNYPNGGLLIGPAWQKVWDLLRESEGFVPAHDISRLVFTYMRRAGSPIAIATVLNLLRSARQVGLLTVKYQIVEGYAGKPAWYARTDMIPTFGDKR